MLFLTPNQQRQNTKAKRNEGTISNCVREKPNAENRDKGEDYIFHQAVTQRPEAGRASGWSADWPPAGRQLGPSPDERWQSWRTCTTFRASTLVPYVRYDGRNPPNCSDSQSLWHTLCHRHLRQTRPINSSLNLLTNSGIHQYFVV